VENRTGHRRHLFHWAQPENSAAVARGEPGELLAAESSPAKAPMVRYFSRVFVVEWITATSSARLHPNRRPRKSYGKNSLCNSNLADDLWRNTNSLLLRVAGKAYGTKKCRYQWGDYR
jgi:hypothetical protein